MRNSSPSMRCEFEMADDHDHDLGARMAGASRMVNAIPAVCAARSGLLSALDLPLVTGAGLVRPVDGPSPTAAYFDRGSGVPREYPAPASCRISARSAGRIKPDWIAVSSAAVKLFRYCVLPPG